MFDHSHYMKGVGISISFLSTNDLKFVPILSILCFFFFLFPSFYFVYNVWFYSIEYLLNTMIEVQE